MTVWQWSIFLYVGAFLAGFVLDVFWALYIQANSDRARLRAALYSVCIGLSQGVFVKSVQEDAATLVFWLCGLFIGTYYANEVEQWFTKYMGSRR